MLPREVTTCLIKINGEGWHEFRINVQFSYAYY